MINTIQEQDLSPSQSRPGLGPTRDTADDIFALAKQSSCQTPKIQEAQREEGSAEVLRGEVQGLDEEKCDFPNAVGDGSGLVSQLHHGRKFSANEIEVMRLRIQNKKGDIDCTREPPQIFSHTTKKVGNGFSFNLPQEGAITEQDHSYFKDKETSPFGNRNKHSQTLLDNQPQNNLNRHYKQLHTIMNQKIDMVSPIKDASIELRRVQQPSTSQPPASTFKPVMSSRDQLNLASVNAWRSPVRTTAVGNINLLTSNIKLNRQLYSGSKNRGYRDQTRDFYQERSDRLEDELIQTQTKLRQNEGSLKIKIALLEQKVTQLKQQMCDAADRHEAQKNQYKQILQIIQQQLKEANLSEASFNAIILNLNQVHHMLIDSTKYNKEVSTKKLEFLTETKNNKLNLSNQSSQGRLKEPYEGKTKSGSDLRASDCDQLRCKCKDLIKELQNEAKVQQERNKELVSDNKELEDRIKFVEEQAKKVQDMYLEKVQNSAKKQIDAEALVKVTEEQESEKNLTSSPISIQYRMDNSCQVDILTMEIMNKWEKAEKLLLEKDRENQSLLDQIPFIIRQIEKIEKLQQGSFMGNDATARSRSHRRNANQDTPGDHNITTSSSNLQIDNQSITPRNNNSALSSRPPISSRHPVSSSTHHNNGTGKCKMIKQQLFGLKQQVEQLLQKDGSDRKKIQNLKESIEDLKVLTNESARDGKSDSEQVQKRHPSPKVSSMKQELANQLLALRSSGENMLPTSNQYKSKREMQKKQQKIVNKAIGKTTEGLDLQLKASTTSFNLSKINRNILTKNEENVANNQKLNQQKIVQSVAHSRNGSQNDSFRLKQQQMRVFSPDDCDWGASPGGTGGGLCSSIVHNRRKMDKYSFQQQNFCMKSMNDISTNQKQNIGAAYGKAKKSRYETFSDNSKVNDAATTDEQAVYFGNDKSHQKKLISNLSNKGSVCKEKQPTDTIQAIQIPQKSAKQQIICGIYCEPKLIEKNQGFTGLRIDEINLSGQYNSGAYNTNPKQEATGSSLIKESKSIKKFDQDEISVVIEPLPRRVVPPRKIFAAEIRKQYESLRPEIQISLSEQDSHNNIAALVTQNASTQISPVKQEAQKAGIMNMENDNPAMETRHRQDYMMSSVPFKDIDSHQIRSKSQNGIRKKNDVQSSKELNLLNPLAVDMHDDDDNVNIDLNTGYYLPNSSNSSNSSGISEILYNDTIEDCAPSSQQLPQKNKLGKKQQSQTARTRKNGVVAVNGQEGWRGQAGNTERRINKQHVLTIEQYDSLFDRLQNRDAKVNKLKIRNKGLKRNVLESKNEIDRLTQQLFDLKNRNEYLELQLQKFECRLKQAQIVLNDPTDQVELQINRGSETRGDEVYVGQKNPRMIESVQQKIIWDNNPITDISKVGRSIEDLNKMKSHIRKQERSRKRSPGTQGPISHYGPVQDATPQQSTGNFLGTSTSTLAPEFGRTEQKSGVVVLNTDRQYIRMPPPSMPKSPSNNPSEQPLQCYQNYQATSTAASFLNKRANSINSTPNLYQFKKQFQSTTKIKQYPETYDKKLTIVPMIDLSDLNERQNTEIIEINDQYHNDSSNIGHKNKTFYQNIVQNCNKLQKNQNSSLSHRNIQLPQSLPFQTPQTCQLSKVKKPLVREYKASNKSSVIGGGDSNYFSQNSNSKTVASNKPKILTNNKSTDLRAMKIKTKQLIEEGDPQGNRNNDQLASLHPDTAFDYQQYQQPTSARVRGPKLESAKTGGNQLLNYDASSAAGGKTSKYNKNSSRICNVLISDEWHNAQQMGTIHSATLMHNKTAKQQPNTMKRQERTMTTVESACVFNKMSTDLGDIKSMASTQPSKSILCPGDTNIKKSMITTTASGCFGLTVSGHDSKSSFKLTQSMQPVAGLTQKRQPGSTKGGGAAESNHQGVQLLHKSSESALSHIPHRQRPAGKKVQQINQGIRR